MFRFVLLLTVAALFLFGQDRQARAETYHTCKGFIDSLPATIGTQGTWCLRKDLSTGMTSGNAIEIDTNNVTIDCNGFKIGGLAAGTGTTATGIHASSKLNATVRHCNIRGFRTGIHFSGSGGHLVEENSLDGNTQIGVRVDSAGSTIRNNMVLDTGGSTVSSGAFGIVASFGVGVINNTVNGVAPEGLIADAYGIYTSVNGEGSVSGNRVNGLAPAGTGVLRGIYMSASSGIIVRDNNVRGPGSGVIGGVGIHCQSNAETARDNVIVGFATGISGCLTSLNVVNSNF